MVLLRRLLGDTLRRTRQRQQRTLREVSSAARVSLGYLSEVERGQKEPSSELLAAICSALEVRLADVLREVSADLDAADALETVGALAAPASEGARNGAGRVVVDPVVIERSDLPVEPSLPDLPGFEALDIGDVPATAPPGETLGSPHRDAQCRAPVSVAA
jgi:transcriptional regulator with XRE-family HTH domain